MERRLTYFDAEFYREIGLTVTQLTFDATSLHATELYRIEAAPPAPPVEPAPPTTRVIEGSWEAVFGGPPEVMEGCEPCPGDAGLTPEELSGPCPWA